MNNYVSSPTINQLLLTKLQKQQLPNYETLKLRNI